MFSSDYATPSDDKTSRRDGAASLTHPTGRHLHWVKIGGSKSCRLRQWSRRRHGPHLSKSDKKVCKYDRPEHQHTNVPAEIEGKTDAKHEQHQAQQRFSLFPPGNEHTRPKGHKDPGCDRTKDLAKVQNAAADHSAG